MGRPAWLGVGSIALVGLVDARPAAGLEAPRYHDLPLGELARPPAQGFPSSIPARESVADFRVEPVRHGASGENILVLRGRSDLCLSSTPVPHLRSAPSAENRWSAASGDALWIGATPKRSYDVHAVHGERVVKRARGVELESIDAFYDVRTGGARLIGRRSVPLARLGASHGVEVYAMREREERVEFVVLWTSRGSASVDVAPNGDSAGAGCSPGRFPLDARLSAGGTFRMTVDVVVHTEDREESRTRPLAVAFGVSRTTRDPEPVLSVTFGWASPR